MNEKLKAAYLETIYMATISLEEQIHINIGKQLPKLDELLTQYHCHDWAYITAWNPFSTPLTHTENQQRNQQLELELAGKTYFSGKGIAKQGDWYEESFLVLGIQEIEAIRIGQKFQQYAIVVGSKEQEARLILL